MSLDRAVVRLILKNTSLLLSVTLMLRCSDFGCSSGFPPAPGDWSRSDILLAADRQRVDVTEGLQRRQVGSLGFLKASRVNQ